MSQYKVKWKHSAVKELKNVDSRYVRRIVQAIEPLSNMPFPRGCRKIFGSDSSYRIRVGDYRVIYQIDEGNKTITIFHVRHRKDAYRK